MKIKAYKVKTRKYAVIQFLDHNKIYMVLPPDWDFKEKWVKRTDQKLHVCIISWL